MDHREAGRLWEDNAEAWTLLARAGYDTYRDHLNTPAFFAALPDVTGLRGLDIGCGEGHNTRLVAARGALVTGLDVSQTFIRHAEQWEGEHPAGIRYVVASAVELPFPDQTFHFATAFMSLMEAPEFEKAISEAWRVLRPGGFLQCSITHPCFDTPHRRNLRGADGTTYAIEVGQYFRNKNGETDEWLFRAAPAALKATLRKFKIPRFTRTLSEWLNAFIAAGFHIEHVGEPKPDDAAIAMTPSLQDAGVVPYFLHLRVKRRE